MGGLQTHTMVFNQKKPPINTLQVVLGFYQPYQKGRFLSYLKRFFAENRPYFIYSKTNINLTH